MRRYSTSEARRRIADVLDGAEHGEVVVIERKGVRFRVTVDRVGPARIPAAAKRPLLEIRDPAVDRGDWTWRPAPDGRGLTFSAGRGSSVRLKRSR
jgi:antitoxin (DNA-binding transcriptional repressor) of toxin-antitoxin stability system